jgi:hypothetical protein
MGIDKYDGEAIAMIWTANWWHSRRADTHVKGIAVIPYEQHIIKPFGHQYYNGCGACRLYYTKIKRSLTAG